MYNSLLKMPLNGVLFIPFDIETFQSNYGYVICGLHMTYLRPIVCSKMFELLGSFIFVGEAVVDGLGTYRACVL